MTTQIEPQAAQIGDTVQDMVGFGVVTGKIIGIDTQGPAILVRWDEQPPLYGPLDVYSLDSPVWSLFMIERPGAPLPEIIQAVLDSEPAVQTAHDAAAWRMTCQGEPQQELASAGFALPWSK